MLVLLDTNVLVRLANPHDPANEIAIEAIAAVQERGLTAVLVPQCCYEFFVVVTRPPGVNGLGLTSVEALRSLNLLTRRFRLLRDERQVFEHWRQLVEERGVRGKPAHDARLVAAMRRHGVTHLLTFNGGDFGRYADEITVLEPSVVAGGA